MVERALWAAAIVIGAVIVWRVYNQKSVQRLSHQLTNTTAANSLLAGLPVLTTHTPVILYFTTAYCAPCRTQQSPTLAQLQGELRDALQVIQIDCEQMPQVADRWGVFSTPTTFVLNADHQPIAVNRGLASIGTLKAQLVSVRFSGKEPEPLWSTIQ